MFSPCSPLQVVENWTFSLFFCISELWGSVVISVSAPCWISPLCGILFTDLHHTWMPGLAWSCTTERMAMGKPAPAAPQGHQCQCACGKEYSCCTCYDEADFIIHLPAARKQCQPLPATRWLLASARTLAALQVLFWSLANEVCSVDDAKTIYPLMGIAANIALVVAGNYMKWVNKAFTRGNTLLSLRTLVGTVTMLTVLMMAAKAFVDRNVKRPEVVSLLCTASARLQPVHAASSKYTPLLYSPLRRPLCIGGQAWQTGQVPAACHAQRQTNCRRGTAPTCLL